MCLHKRSILFSVKVYTHKITFIRNYLLKKLLFRGIVIRDKNFLFFIEHSSKFIRLNGFRQLPIPHNFFFS